MLAVIVGLCSGAGVSEQLVLATALTVEQWTSPNRAFVADVI